MESNWLTRNKRTISLVIVMLLFTLFVYNVRRSLMGTLSPFIYASIFSYLLNPFINMLQKRGVKRFWSSLLSVLLIFVGLLIFFAYFIPNVISDATVLIRRLSLNIGTLRKLFDELIHTVEGWFGNSLNVQNTVSELLDTGLNILSDGIKRAIASLNSLLDVFLIPVITFYMLKDKDMILRDTAAVIREPLRSRIKEIGGNLHKLLTGYVKGKIIISFFVGLLTALGCMAIGIPNVLTIGIVSGLFDLIPYFGPYIGAMLPVMLALIGPTPIKALWVIILIIIIQQTESNLITPRILSERVGLHPLVVMFSVMFFGSVMGIPGMILGVPIMTVLLALVKAALKWDSMTIHKHEKDNAPMAPQPPDPADVAAEVE
ncbi:MAG: AI-2E family transporter [Clostridiales bacterium]|nr:AI-2E family transporter [Clostridiales bacterium]